MCGCSGSGSSVNIPTGRLSGTDNYTQNANMRVKNENCPYDQGVISNWKTILECVISNDKLSVTGITRPQANQYLGLFQSALNYPDDYCYYEVQLNLFKEAILPLILNNVQECIK